MAYDNFTLDNVSLTRDNQPIFSDLSFQFHSHEIIGVIGPNGVGKSSLLLMLARLLQPSSGTIFLSEKSLNTISRQQMAKAVGIAFQQSESIFDLSVYEALSIASHIDNNSASTAIIRIAEQLHLKDKLSYQCSQLSGGEYQRLSIAQVFIQDPDIYLLDEPTNHLDYVFQKEIAECLVRLNQTRNKTVFVVSHDINWVADIASQILLLYPNQAFEYGCVESVLTEHNLSRLYQTRLAKTASWSIV